jgi:leucine dehydrogenase
VPDYVISAGGIIDIFHQRNESTAEKSRAQLEEIGQTVTLILTQSRQLNKPAEQVANQIAEEKFRH